MNEKELAKIFMEEAIKYEKMRENQYAIPPDLFPIFVGHTGYWPLFLVIKKILERTNGYAK